jgi:hypothetical protein
MNYPIRGAGLVGVAVPGWANRPIAMPRIYGGPVYNQINVCNQFNNVRIGGYYRPAFGPFYGNCLNNGFAYNYWGLRPLGGIGAGIALAGVALGTAAVTAAAIQQQTELAALYPQAYYGAPPQYLLGDGLNAFTQVMQSTNPLARNSVGELVNQPMFARLTPQSQTALLQLVGNNPGSMPAVRNALLSCQFDPTGTRLPALQALLADPRMATLGVYRQPQVLQAFAQNPDFAAQMLAAAPLIPVPIALPQPGVFVAPPMIPPDVARSVADLVTRGAVWTDHGKIRGAHQITDPRDVYQRLERGAGVVINGVMIKSLAQLPGVLATT